MRPKEFISRALSLIEFDPWPEPDSFNSAAMALALREPRCAVEVNGYTFHFQSKMCLGHVIMLVEVNDDREFLVGGSICFTFQQFDFGDEPPVEDNMYESWRLPEKHTERIDRIMEVLVFLTLKTNPHIFDKVSR